MGGGRPNNLQSISGTCSGLQKSDFGAASWQTVSMSYQKRCHHFRLVVADSSNEDALRLE